MWRSLVLFAVLAVSVAEPSTLIASPLLAPLTYSSTVLAPATTTITKQASSVVHPSPYLTYSTPYFGHFIKKRSAPLLAYPYIAPALTYSSPFLPTTYAAPAVLPAPSVIAHAPLAYTHYIKKRSAPVFTPYIAAPNIAFTPLLHSPYAAHLIPAGQIYAPGIYRHPHVIKKRTLGLITSVARWFFGGNNNRRRENGGRNNNHWW